VAATNSKYMAVGSGFCANVKPDEKLNINAAAVITIRHTGICIVLLEGNIYEY
jgi:hypothetical protein